VGHAHGRVTLHLDPDEDAVEGHAPHEGAGAIDGVQDPADRVRSPGFPEFLPENAVAGPGFLDAIAEEGFRLAVRDRDRRAIALRLVVDASSEVPEGDLARGAGESLRVVQQAFEKRPVPQAHVDPPPSRAPASPGRGRRGGRTSLLR
jgi:hypothetical protein